MTHKLWGSTVSDTDSVVGGNDLGSPTNSAGAHWYFSFGETHKKYLDAALGVMRLCWQCDYIVGDISKIARTSSTGTISSNEDADEKDGALANFEPSSKTE